MSKIIPLPEHVGYGFTSSDALPAELAAGYHYVPIGRFHNYHATPENWKWPFPWKKGTQVVDGFSPNLNKELHCGHLKNLAVANALAKILGGDPVAMLGASLGIKENALPTYYGWCNLAGYFPVVYFDNKLPEPKVELEDGTGEYEGCKLYQGVVIYRSNGSPTYAAHDLAFSQIVGPDFYLTGAEQKSHFASLGLGDKHLALGLVLGADGKKMRSSIKKEGEEANALSANELFQAVLDCLSECPEPAKLAWNILAWQFNSSQISTNTKFHPQDWAKPEAPGLYITYTHARIKAALGTQSSIRPQAIEPEDVPLLALSEYHNYAITRAQTEKEPHHLANYCLTLSKMLSHLYKKRNISGGSPSYIYAISVALNTLKTSMQLLGMHALEKV